jgi:isoquinoline 1-oxidoreductase subunit beta
MLIAEEMDIPVSDVTVDLADARPELLFNQQTQGSASVISIYTPVRVAAALARGRLIEAAATILGDEAENLRTTAGRVLSTTGSNIPFAELATAAANEVTREAVAELKPTDEFSVIGTEQRRDDVVAAVTGRKKYTMDLDVPEALPTMIARPPTIKGTVESIDNLDEVRSMPGVTDVVEISTDAEPGRGTTSSAVAVRARTFGQCIDAVNALDITWGRGNVDGESDASILAQLRATDAPANLPSPTPLDAVGGQVPLATGVLGRDRDDAGGEGVLDGAVDAVAEVGPVEAIEQEFVFYWRSNAAMEPNVAIADVRDGEAEVWTPSQIPSVNTRTAGLGRRPRRGPPAARRAARAPRRDPLGRPAPGGAGGAEGGAPAAVRRRAPDPRAHPLAGLSITGRAATARPRSPRRSPAAPHAGRAAPRGARPGRGPRRPRRRRPRSPRRRRSGPPGSAGRRRRRAAAPAASA